ncbi:TIGR00725 family protein [Thalassolituus hydrocarboniclasticus]|uniref:TIGR00725 family protein n=1 Tax=Thalassolituus hydrocarboniclasticus TaxID=2742796 RepID=A0ABY6AAI6_9GAMM|nr:TIGR00725 family protein [Thalassolituus hydrocarboniclasticus]UXD87720.1 TIGR00725 family protein [Thalassolituus hydrocarboniclasticus]
MTEPSQRLLIAVVGSASNSLPESQKQLALEVGQQVVDSGCRLICGGMGGVMMYAAQGAHQSAHYCPGDVIGVLPSYQKTEANPFIDIALPTGLGVARNAVLMAACDAVVALDGGSGTLSEIALAWQMQKPIACIGDQGWHQRLNSLTLDQRRDDTICVLDSLAELQQFLSQLHDREHRAYSGIQLSGVGRKPSESLRTLEHYLEQSFSEQCHDYTFELLGQGSEGVVFTCGPTIFKVFYRSDFTMLLFTHLSQISQRLKAAASHDYSPVPRFDVHKGEYLVVSYPRFESVPYRGGEQPCMVNFLRAMHRAGVCLSNVKAENFRTDANGNLVFIDIGRDLMPFSDVMFLSMCKRAFLTVYFSQHPAFKTMCSYTNDHEGFMPVTDHDGNDLSAEQVMNLFGGFYQEVRRGCE